MPFVEQRQSGGFWPETLLAKQVTQAECDLSYPRISREAFRLVHAPFLHRRIMNCTPDRFVGLISEFLLTDLTKLDGHCRRLLCIH